MARTAIRTATLSLDDISRMTDLFGTIMNAHRRLGLENAVPYSHFYRGMHFNSITPRHKELIEEAWARWKFLFLRPEVPPSSDFTIKVENRDENPVWLPEEIPA